MSGKLSSAIQSFWSRTAKRSFDIFASLTGLLILGWLILIGWVVATFDTKQNGFFLQNRIGYQGKPFRLIKLRTMRHSPGVISNITVEGDPRITFLGKYLRKFKLDELPQLANVLLGDMSFVGPRPDVPGYADRLVPSIKNLLLSVRPGITGPATLAYRNEEHLLAKQPDPNRYNDEVIFPDKVRINIYYIQNWNFWRDIYYIWKTIIY
jgi:lipopolysaccharide/colanic/teichoic acid biosynthesis glycosyltransferase